MERRSSLVEKFIVMILAVCMNMSLANGATAFPQAGNSSAMTPDQLDKLMAPIALYPDALLMQVLAASVNSQEVLDGGNWLLQNKSLEGDQLDGAAKAAGFGPAMVALFHFPQVVDMMCSELDWTKQLGEAFTANQSAVLDSVQRLRLQAKQAGNLQTTPQQTVVTQQASGQQIIVIQPTNPQIVYVPQYNPVQVYVPPTAAPQSSGVSTETAVAGALIAFGVGMAVGSMFSSNNYYYYPRWGYGGGVYYRGGPWVSHHYVYRPVYGPNYHRATLYYRPPNYAYAYNRPYPGNAHYNPNNYYNNYRGNTNNQNKSNNTVNRNVSGNNVTINTGNQVNKTGNTVAKGGNAQSNPSWKGQTTYNGSKANNGNAAANPTRNPSTTNNRANYSSQAQNQSVKPDRGYSSGSTPSSPARSPSQPAAQTRPAGAFEGAGNTGRSEKTASQRGAASTQGSRGKRQ
jgi:hypothetical protein